MDEQEVALYNDMQVRVEAFIARFRESLAYDFETTAEAANRAAIELEDCIRLYAKGGVDERGVEACARLYVTACKRPEAVERGTKTPPLPPQGTYPGKTQANYARKLSQPPPVKSSLAPVPAPEGEPQDLEPDAWRIARLEIEYIASPLSPFKDVSLAAGSMGYAKYNAHSLEAYAERPHLWATQFYSPDAPCCY